MVRFIGEGWLVGKKREETDERKKNVQTTPLAYSALALLLFKLVGRPTQSLPEPSHHPIAPSKPLLIRVRRNVNGRTQ